MVGDLARHTSLIGSTWRNIGCVAACFGTGCGKNCPELLTLIMRAPASRGQRDAGAVNPIRPGAVGQIGGSLRQGWSTLDRRSRPVGPVAGNGDYPGVARLVG
jgi:hypothetical protein